MAVHTRAQKDGTKVGIMKLHEVEGNHKDWNQLDFLIVTVRDAPTLREGKDGGKEIECRLRGRGAAAVQYCTTMREGRRVFWLWLRCFVHMCAATVTSLSLSPPTNFQLQLLSGCPI